MDKQLQAHLQKLKREIAIIPTEGSSDKAIEAFRDAKDTGDRILWYILTEYAHGYEVQFEDKADERERTDQA